MRIQFLRLGVAVVVIAALTGLGYAQVTDTTKETLPGMSVSGMIDGRVVLPSGRSVNSVIKVTLEVGGNPVKTAYTDTNGEFHIRDVSEGLYSVRVYGDARLYDVGGQDVRMQPGANVRLMIYLREKTARSSEDMEAAGVISAEDWDRRAPKDAKKAYEKAEKMIASGQIPEAIDQLHHALGIYPDYPTARNTLGVQYLKRNQLPEASEQFEYILTKAPKYFDARFNLGLVRVQQRRYKDAVTELASASSIDSSNAPCHLWLGVAWLETSEFQSAEQEIDRAQALGGRQLSATHYYLGQVYLREGRKDDACKQFSEYVSESPTGDLANESRKLLDQCSTRKSSGR